MRVRTPHQTFTLVEDENALRLSDVQPRQVFRFVKGKPENFYIMGAGGKHYALNSGIEFEPVAELAQAGPERFGRPTTASRAHRINPLVEIYPDAELVTGEPVTAKPPKEAK